MVVPISNTIIATIVYSVAMCFGIALLAGLGRKAKKTLVGTLKLYEDKSLLYFSIMWFLIWGATFILVPIPMILFIGNIPLSIWLVKKTFKAIRKRGHKNEA